MENWDARQSQLTAGISNASEYNQNIVAFESHRHLRDAISELIYLTTSSTLTSSDLQQHLNVHKATFGNRFAIHLVRALLHADEDERDAVIWLLTQFDDRETIAPLQQLAQNTRLPRSLRLSASLALAGLGATPEMRCREDIQDIPRRTQLYAIS